MEMLPAPSLEKGTHEGQEELTEPSGIPVAQKYTASMDTHTPSLDTHTSSLGTHTLSLTHKTPGPLGDMAGLGVVCLSP